MALAGLFEVREAGIPGDLPAVERLWLEYLTWGNDEMEAVHGFRMPGSVPGTVTRDLASIDHFRPPHGRLLLAVDAGGAFGTGALRRIGPDTAEIKRMYVEPSHRGVGAGRAILDALISAAREAGYARIRLDSPDFMTAAHPLYRSRGFVEIGQYPETEVPAPIRSYWLFMELALR